MARGRGKGRRQNKYVTLKIPIGLAKKIDEMIEASDGDYTSRTDVVKTSTRLLYREKHLEKKRLG